MPHHQEIESALIKLYRVTKERRYLRLAQFFIDRRGHFEDRPTVTFYGQDHLPVRRQSEIVGHAVRGMYHCVNIASLYTETGDAELLAAAHRLWESATQRKLYVTGGVGAVGRGESFGNDYQLPNETAYAETCAGIGLVFFAHEMWRITPDAEYIDVLELALYNEVLGGVAITGDAFFYPNKLLSTGQEGWGSMRQRWFRCACCPSNICRFIPAVPGYMYGHLADNLYINSFIPGTAVVRMDRGTVTVKQETRYPWDGAVKITVNPAEATEFTINVRIPGWARNQPSPGDLYRYADQTIPPPVSLRVNGKDVTLNLKRGYAAITRKWAAGDAIALDMPMPVRHILAHEKVFNNAERVALQRGPVVYCAEWPDNGGKVLDIVLDDARFHYWIGSFDGKTFKPEAGPLRVDYGKNFYAAQSWHNTKDRRIHTGWMRGGEYPGMPFNQQMSFPCELTLRTVDKGIKLFRYPVKEIETLHTEPFELADQTLKPGSNPLSHLAGDLFDIEMEIVPGASAEFGIRLHTQAVTYANNRISCLGSTANLSPVDGTIKLRILVDRTSIEVFANDGEVSMTSCFLPKEKSTGLEFYTKDGNVTIRSLRVSKLKSSWTPETPPLKP